MNSITMKMQADKLIRMALQEDRKGRRNHRRTGCICESIPDPG